MSRHESVVLNNIYPLCHSLSFIHLFLLIDLLAWVLTFNIPQTFHTRVNMQQQGKLRGTVTTLIVAYIITINVPTLLNT